MATAAARKPPGKKGGKKGGKKRPPPKIKTGRARMRGSQLEVHRLRLNGRPIDVGLKGAFSSADLEETIEGASVLRITVRDYKRALMRSALARTSSRLTLDDLHYRLAKVEKQGDNLSLAFEEEAVYVLRGQTGKLKKRRSQMTRAQFVGLLAREPKRYFIPFKAPEARETQPIKGSDGGGGGGDAGSAWRGKDVLHLGDSLAVGTNPPLNKLIGKTDYDGDEGRSSPVTVNVLRNKLAARHEVVIFDAGTNDGSAATLRSSLNEARDLTGKRPLIIFTVNSGANSAALNDAVREFADNHAGIYVIDWRGYSQEHDLIGSDGIHPTGAGYAQRARLVANKLGHADGGGGGAGGATLLAAPTASASGASWSQKIDEGNLTVKGVRANSHQAHNMSLIVSIGREMGANLESIKGAMATAIVESQITNLRQAGAGAYYGIFQQTPFETGGVWGTYAQVTTPKYAIKKFFSVYLPYRRKGEDWLTASDHTQRSANPTGAAPFEDEALKNATYFWGRQRGGGSEGPGGGGEPAGGTTRTRTVPYEFSRGTSEKGEDSWEAMGRLAGEVRWTRFMRGGVLWYVSQEWLGAQRAKFKLREFSQGVHAIDFSWDARRGTQPIDAFFANAAECSVTLASKRYGILPGDAVELVDVGVASGKWITASISRSLLSPVAQVTLKRAQDKLPEPPAETRQVTVNNERGHPNDHGGGGGGGGPSGERGQITGDIGGLTLDMRIFVEKIAGQFGKTISVNSGRRPNDYDSNHLGGRAADLNIGVGEDTRQGDLICKAALIVCGVKPRTAEYISRQTDNPNTNFSINHPVTIRGNQHSVEIGWRTYEGGNHHNHVHVGFDD